MGKSQPDTPDPRETSAAQTGTNIGTAIANSFMGNVNEVTPDGSKTFAQSGKREWLDPYTGKSYTIPTFTMTQKLSPNQQAIKYQQDRADTNLSKLGADLSGQLGNKLTGNFSLNNEATESRLWELGRKRLDPMMAQQDEDLRTRLANQGIKAGSAAYDREMNNFSQSKNDAYNQLLLTGRGQAAQEALTEDNQRINQISALMSGGQVSMPQFMTGANVSPIATTDNAAIINQNYANQMNAWQQKQASIGSALSGIGGLFSLSDERAKEGKKKIAETKDGFGIYSYRYKGDPETRVGLMAQEVMKKKPDAVAQRHDGLFAVDYEKALRG